MDIIAIFIVIAGIAALALSIAAGVDGDDLWKFFLPSGCVLIILGGSIQLYRQFNLSQIDTYTVNDIAVVNMPEGIYRINLIKDPGALFTNEAYSCYTTKPKPHGYQYKEGEC